MVFAAPTRLQLLILWAPSVAILLAIMYPATNFYLWHDNPYAVVSYDPVGADIDKWLLKQGYDSKTGKKSEAPLPPLGSWDKLEAERFRYMKDPDTPWTQDIGRRKLIVTMEQWTEWHDNVRLDIKTEPDCRRMGAEVGIAFFVGLGLYVALIRRHSPAPPSQ
jgi:hypothetical protein